MSTPAIGVCRDCGRPTTCRCHPRPGARIREAVDLCHACGVAQRRPRGTHGNSGARLEPADEAVVLRVVAGDRLPMNLAERREVVRRLTDAGWSLNRIARHTGLSHRTVQRHRAIIPRRLAA